jgi:D-ribose pyranase
MKRTGILNRELCAAIAALGHGDMLLVVDAGFPVPRDVWRIDLAVAADLPDLRTVLGLIHRELIAERVVVAAEVEAHNPQLDRWLREEFAGAELERRPHAAMLAGAAQQAKAIVRTGAFDPWGNVGLVSGVDAPRWFAREGVVVPEAYSARIAAMETAAGKPG